MSIAVEPEPVPLAQDEYGALRVGDTRITLETLVAAFDRGDSPEEIHEQFPSVALSDVYAVLTYCLRHPVSVKEYLIARAASGAEVQARIEAAFPPEGLRSRLVSRLDQ